MKSEFSNPENQSASHAAAGLVGGLFFLLLIVGAWFDLSPEVIQPVFRENHTGPAPNGAAARLGRGPVNALAIAPDAATVAIGGEVGVFVYNADTLEEVWAIPSEIPIISISYSPDGALLAAGLKDGTLALLNARNGFLLNAFGGGGEVEVQSLAWSPDGTTLVGGHGSGKLFFWDFSEGVPTEPYKELDGHLSWVTDLAFSQDGKWVASAGADTRILLWDLESNRPPRALAGHEDVVRGLAFHPDGSQLASGSLDHQVMIWELSRESVADLRPQMRIGHSADVLGLSWSPDGSLLASGSQDGTVILWEGDLFE